MEVEKFSVGRCTIINSSNHPQIEGQLQDQHNFPEDGHDLEWRDICSEIVANDVL